MGFFYLFVWPYLSTESCAKRIIGQKNIQWIGSHSVWCSALQWFASVQDGSMAATFTKRKLEPIPFRRSFQRADQTNNWPEKCPINWFTSFLMQCTVWLFSPPLLQRKALASYISVFWQTKLSWNQYHLADLSKGLTQRIIGQKNVQWDGSHSLLCSAQYGSPFPYFKETGRPSIHLIDFEVNLKEWGATLHDLGRPSIQLVHFEVN